MCCVCVRNIKETTQKEGEEEEKSSGVMVQEEVIHELYSRLAGLGRTETPTRMFGLGRESET